MAMHYTLVGVTPTNTDWIADYVQSVPAMVAKHGGRYIVNTGEYERLEGEDQGRDPALIVILEWPSKEAETAFMSDPEYAPFHQARLEGGTNNALSLSGLD